MARCLEPKDLDRLITGRLSSRRAGAVRRHIRECEACVEALAEAEANEAWLEELRRAREVADLRQRVARNPVTQSTDALTTLRPD
jgi:anti-sigma factor RsiW